MPGDLKDRISDTLKTAVELSESLLSARTFADAEFGNTMLRIEIRLTEGLLTQLMSKVDWFGSEIVGVVVESIGLVRRLLVWLLSRLVWFGDCWCGC
jgi:hypothetical protein